MYLGIKKIHSFQTIELNSSINWIISSILYASYNSISLIPILISLKRFVKNKKEIKRITSCTFIIMAAVTLIIYLLINNYWVEIKKVEIPIMYIANKMGILASYIYGGLILSAIFTTAISAGYSFLNSSTNSKNRYMVSAVIICTISIFFGQLEFARLISSLYPVFGYLGLLQIFFLLSA